MAPAGPPLRPPALGPVDLDQDGDGRGELPRGGGGGVRPVPHCLHGGVRHEGGGGDEACQEEDVQT